MVVIYRAHGLRFVVYSMDHQPAHVHIIGDGELKVDIAGESGRPEIIWSKGMKPGNARRALADAGLAGEDMAAIRLAAIRAEIGRAHV